MTEQYLEHHGVKGMKWGIRKNLKFEGKNRAKNNKNRDNRVTDASKKRIKKAVVVGSAATGAVLAAYGAYKVYDVSIPKTIKVSMPITKEQPYQVVTGYRHTHLGGRTQTWPVWETKVRYVTEMVEQEIKNPRRIIP